MSRNRVDTVDMEILHGIFQSDGFAAELLMTAIALQFSSQIVFWGRAPTLCSGEAGESKT
jgi:hypothetical protein